MYTTFRGRAICLLLLLIGFSAKVKAQTVNADFSVGYTRSCTEVTANFTNLSTASGTTITGYQWRFEDGSTSTATNPTRLYTTNGPKAIRLITIGASGARDTSIQTIYVSGIIRPNFDVFVQGSLCTGNELQITSNADQLDSLGSIYFDFDDGSDFTTGGYNVVPKIYFTAGTFNMKVVITNKYGCKDSIIKTLVINKRPKGAVQYTPACQGTDVVYTASGSDVSGVTVGEYRWLWHDGSQNTGVSVTKNFTTPGFFTGKLVIRNDNVNACSDTTNFSYTVIDNPDVNWQASPHCISEIGIFVNKSTYVVSFLKTMTIEWGHQRNNNPAISVFDVGTTPVDTAKNTFPGPGTYNIKITGENFQGCKTVQTFQHVVYPLPGSNFTLKNTCKDSTFTFIATTPTNNSPIVQYRWNFGDPDSGPDNIAFGQTATHVYTLAGSKTVKLFSTNANGCVDSATKTITIYGKPLVDFAFNDACRDSTYSFLSLSKANTNDSPVIRHYWDFGDGATSTLKDPTHVYTSDGSYTVKHASFNQFGCGDTVEYMVTVHPSPIPDFNNVGNCEGDSIAFFSTSTIDPSDSIASYYWNFGNNTFDVGPSPKALYQAPGLYDVYLTTTSSKGCPITTNKQVSILPSPRPDFTSTPVCINTAVQFTDATTYAIPSTTQSWNWDFGDTTTSTDQNPTHLYANIGNYLVTLRVVGTNGCTRSISRNVTVSPIPVADFSTFDNCFDSLIRFTNLSTLSFGTIARYEWDFGDSSTSTMPNPTHKYKSAGTWNVKFKVVSNAGCSDSIVKTITTYPKPTARVLFDRVCADTNVNFYDQSTITGPGASIAAWRWEFDFGTIISGEQNPTFKFPKAGGNYPVRFIVYSNRGCADTLDTTVFVYREPVPNFFALERCEDNPYSFFDQTTPDPQAIPVAYKWFFGDGDSSDVQNPVHVYQDSGNYDVRFIITSSFGCQDTAIRTIRAQPLPYPVIDFDGACFNSPFRFSDKSVVVGGIDTRSWQFGDGNTSSQPNPVNTYTDSPGVYRVRLILRATLGGCDNFKDSFIRVYPNPSVKFTTNPVCLGKTNVFEDKSTVNFSDIQDIRMTWGDGLTDVYKKGDLITHTYNAPGIFVVNMTALTDRGCRGSFDTTIEVYDNPIADFEADPPFTTILEPELTFIDRSTSAVSWTWDFGDGEGSTDQNPKHIFVDTGNYSVRLIVRNSDGCVDTMIKVISNLEVYNCFAASAFTPNGDDINDTWKPICTGFANYSVFVVNRWGQRVFESTDPEESWNGRYMNTGDMVPEGVYTFSVIANDVYETEFKELKGKITLIY